MNNLARDLLSGELSVLLSSELVGERVGELSDLLSNELSVLKNA